MAQFFEVDKLLKLPEHTILDDILNSLACRQFPQRRWRHNEGCKRCSGLHLIDSVLYLEKTLCIRPWRKAAPRWRIPVSDLFHPTFTKDRFDLPKRRALKRQNILAKSSSSWEIPELYHPPVYALKDNYLSCLRQAPHAEHLLLHQVEKCFLTHPLQGIRVCYDLLLCWALLILLFSFLLLRSSFSFGLLRLCIGLFSLTG